MDINMPVMDGYTAAKLLRDAHDQILLIAMTGAPAHETRAKAHEAGFHHHFSKPIELSDLAALLSCDTMDHLLPGFHLRP
jgi:CheY-like chemotaxis protein